jgi:hypothetical protein
MWRIKILIFETGELFSFHEDEEDNNSHSSEMEVKNLMKYYQPYLILRRSNADSCEQYHPQVTFLSPVTLLPDPTVTPLIDFIKSDQ